ncbi:LuxR C-terminal-related transcriptional regulator [Porticoccaceae bacterium]|nr:LuxR C-terminal-related transcriptional regulator [Porticoccaceae bacterium]MDA8663454.1 LuxR C-terminal-related transcriptional regulator [Porticoccaceae bacterium]MDA8682286.1 LuxR C-terminal-related transcriptional regulator [Porticoccaceae bacterium]MDB2343814.1 LuxR C-terminal-related transcriptional regulator [Porticoccaceae bacterium]
MTKSEKLERAFEIVNACLTATTDEDLEFIWLAMQELCNIDGLMMGVSESDEMRDMAKTTLLRSYGIPDEWHEVYLERKFALVDPVVKMFHVTQDVFSWEEAYARFGHEAIDFINTANKFGLKNGYAAGVLSEDYTGIAHSVSVTVQEDILTEEDREFIKTLLPHLNRVLSKPGFLQDPEFTEQQLEVMRWAAKNKSSWEIGQIMSISDRTVKYHFQNIYRKLGVYSRSDAILKAKIKGVI